jgi:hypothetical protein
MTGQEDALHYRTATIDDLEEVVAANIAMAKVQRLVISVLAAAAGSRWLQRNSKSSSSSSSSTVQQVDSSICSGYKAGLFNGLFADRLQL